MRPWKGKRAAEPIGRSKSYGTSHPRQVVERKEMGRVEENAEKLRQLDKEMDTAFESLKDKDIVLKTVQLDLMIDISQSLATIADDLNAIRNCLE